MVICRWRYLCCLFIYNILFGRRFLCVCVLFETNSMPWMLDMYTRSKEILIKFTTMRAPVMLSLFIYESMDVSEKKKQKHVTCHWFGFFVTNVIVGSLIPISQYGHVSSFTANRRWKQVGSCINLSKQLVCYSCLVAYSNPIGWRWEKILLTQKNKYLTTRISIDWKKILKKGKGLELYRISKFHSNDTIIPWNYAIRVPLIRKIMKYD